jgi:hypothetical protein
MAGDKGKGRGAVGQGGERVNCKFTVTINVQAPHDFSAHVRALVDAEFQRLTTAIQQKKK